MPHNASACRVSVLILSYGGEGTLSPSFCLSLRKKSFELRGWKTKGGVEAEAISISFEVLDNDLQDSLESNSSVPEPNHPQLVVDQVWTTMPKVRLTTEVEPPDPVDSQQTADEIIPRPTSTMFLEMAAHETNPLRSCRGPTAEQWWVSCFSSLQISRQYRFSCFESSF